MNKLSTKIFVLSFSFFALIFALIVLWQYNYKYSLPTPKPIDFQEIAFGESSINSFKNTKKFTFLHFFNPKCPCSKFNIKHVNQLFLEYKDKIDFKVVIEEKYKNSYNNIFDFDVIYDNGSLADSCGIYATPQLVLLDKNGVIQYKGNYNVNRFCTNNKTYFSQIAIQNLLNNEKINIIPQSQVAYGCQLESDLNILKN